jgi:hypothetical protein
MAIDFDLIKQTAVLRSEELLREWYPEGRVRGAEFVIGDPEGNKGESMSISLSKGFGADFATGQKFGDLIDVYAARFGVDIKIAVGELAERLGIPQEQTRTKRVQTERKKPEPKAEPVKLDPIPDDVSLEADQFVIPVRGQPDHVYVYRNTDGQPVSVVARWNANDQESQPKLFMPWTYRDGWVRKAPPTPRMLYGLEELGKTRNVLVVEGEKAADHARQLFPHNPVVSWPNGAAAVKSADWSPLAGRKVIVWPDNDAPGRAALNELGAILTPIIDGPLRYVDPGNVATGFDAADLGNVTESEALEWVKKRIKVWEPPKQEKVVVKEEFDTEGEFGKAGVWETLGLECRPSGTPYASVDNAVRVLNHRIKDGDIHYDSFLNQIRFNTELGFVKLQDHHLITLTIMMQREFGIQDMKKTVVTDAVAFYARSRIRNCLQEFLLSLQWDGVSRIEEFFITGFGAENNEYTRAVGKNFLIGMIARAMKPGCQLDTLPILEGEQGIGKSRGLEALAGEYYADIDTAMGTREFAEQIQGKWLVELSELSAMRPSEVEKIKSGITRTIDVYREPFAVLASDHPRQCVFAGTTNAKNYLMDDTGNRRFWPVKCGEINRQWIRDHREKIFAEALTLYQQGANWWSVPVELAEKETSERMFVDGLLERVGEYVEFHASVRISEILKAWEIPEAQWNQPLQKRIASALRAHGYHAMKSNGVQVWRKADAPTVIPLRFVRKL